MRNIRTEVIFFLLFVSRTRARPFLLLRVSFVRSLEYVPLENLTRLFGSIKHLPARLASRSD